MHGMMDAQLQQQKALGSAYGSAGQVGPSGEIEGQLRNLEDAIGFTGGLVSQLWDRLASVLPPPQPAANAANATKADVCVSAMGQRLQSIVAELRQVGDSAMRLGESIRL